MKFAKPVFGIFFAGLFAACSGGNEPVVSNSVPLAAEKKLSAPFRFQKAIEVKPGLTFDVLSWGRGADSTAAYLILRSDSTKNRYISTSGELTGTVSDAWNMDMDSDGNPEIFIQTKNKRSLLNLYVNEFDASGGSQRLRFPDLSDATRKKYRGQDTLYVRDGKLIREFPLYKDSDAVNKPTDGRKYIGYGLSGNEFTVQNLTANGEPEKVQVTEAPKPKKTVKKKTKRRRR